MTPADPLPHAMNAQGLTPILNVSSLPDSFAWFARFGWKKLWDWHDQGHEGEPTFGAVASGKVELFLCRDTQGGRGDGTGVWMSLWVDDVDAVHAQCMEAGLDIRQAPTDEPWGVREMHVRHPDGHVFRVGTSMPCAD